MPVKRLGAVTGETYFSALKFSGFDGPRGAVTGPRGYLTLIARQSNTALPPLSEVAGTPALPAWLCEDRWIVSCPDCGRDQQLAWPSVGLYLCPRCWNHAVGGLWRRYTLPAERPAIEVLVADAPPERRTWLPVWDEARTLAETRSPRPLSASEILAAVQPKRPARRVN